MIESIEKDVKSYEAKAGAMLGAINTSIFFIVLFSIYVLMPDFFQSICEILSRTMLSLIDESSPDPNSGNGLRGTSEVFLSLSKSRDTVGDLKGVLTTIPVLFAAIFAGSYVNYRFIFNKLHELNMLKHKENIKKSEMENTNKQINKDT